MSEVALTQPSVVAQLEAQRDDFQRLIARRQVAMRLAQVPEFKELILDGFCLKDAARYVQESGDPALKAEERADALALAQASGHLKRFLQITIQMGAHAERTLPELDAALVEARQEEDAA